MARGRVAHPYGKEVEAMKTREEDYRDRIEFELSLSVNVNCYGCENYETVSISLNEFSVDHADWHIYGPSDFSVAWALKEAKSGFKLCAKDDYHYSHHVRYYCPTCQEVCTALVELVDKVK